MIGIVDGDGSQPAASSFFFPVAQVFDHPNQCPASSRAHELHECGMHALLLSVDDVF